MRTVIYELYDTATEQIVATTINMTPQEVREANDTYRENGEAVRWIKAQ